jgi:hypothetical protein
LNVDFYSGHHLGDPPIVEIVKVLTRLIDKFKREALFCSADWLSCFGSGHCQELIQGIVAFGGHFFPVTPNYFYF